MFLKKDLKKQRDRGIIYFIIEYTLGEKYELRIFKKYIKS